MHVFQFQLATERDIFIWSEGTEIDVKSWMDTNQSKNQSRTSMNWRCRWRCRNGRITFAGWRDSKEA